MDKGFAHNSSLVSTSILAVDSANSIRSSHSVAVIVGVRTRNKKENNKMKVTNEQWRAWLMSSKDIEFKNLAVICKECNRNQYSDNVWKLEYKQGDEWFVYSVYCDDCCEEHFPEAELITVGIKQ
tara:strand:- start:171 stop:545 length:375 start_codon:yes stop_codon:yes gene_type:complete